MEKEKFSLKDQLFNEGKIIKIANDIARVYPAFKKDKFIKNVVQSFPELELKQRITHITECLRNHLPESYAEALEIILNSLPEPCNPTLNDNDFGDFIYAAHGQFVAQFGCSEEFLELSLDALEAITMRFSAEYAIRNFINAFPEKTLNRIQHWSKHLHYHVRRLASEGTRPKLPWGMKIGLSVEAPLSILDTLHADSTRFVTRSVANHLNDIAKTHPDLVLERLNHWKKQKLQNPKELDFIIRHALRTLIKKGDNRALELIGISALPKIQIQKITVSESVQMNENLEKSIAIVAQEDCALLIDYVIHFQNSKGEMNSVKVFKWKQILVKKNEQIQLSKRHEMKQFMTTRTLYPGKHQWSLQVNGEIVHQQEFELTV
jgi:3-methyladenine DNA glycosylase AlkC